jgi:prepilin-type N-terminal cleavage/methylation domain-containing protein
VAKRASLGFTLIEMMVVVAIVVILAAFAIPAMFRATDQAKTRGAARTMLGHLAKARQLAASGREDASWPAGSRTIEAGVIIAATGYQIFVDRNDVTDGDEIIVEAVDWAPAAGFETKVGDRAADSLVITAPPPGAEIRFRKNGTLAANPPVDQTIIIRDTQSGAVEELTVSFGGSVQLAARR